MVIDVETGIDERASNGVVVSGVNRSVYKSN